MVSGCYPLDDFYKSSDEYERLMAVKKGVGAALMDPLTPGPSPTRGEGS